LEFVKVLAYKGAVLKRASNEQGELKARMAESSFALFGCGCYGFIEIPLKQREHMNLLGVLAIVVRNARRNVGPVSGKRSIDEPIM